MGGYLAGTVSDIPGQPRMDNVNNIRGIPEEDKHLIAQKLELLEQKEVGIIEDLYRRHFKETGENQMIKESAPPSRETKTPNQDIRLDSEARA